MIAFLIVAIGWLVLAVALALVVGGSITLADRGGPVGRHRQPVASDSTTERAA